MTSYLQIIVPSRGRPWTVAKIVEAVSATRQGDVRVTFAVDPDDPMFTAYLDAVGFAVNGDDPHALMVNMIVAMPDPVKHGRGMVGALNHAALGACAREVPPAGIMFMGDDHRPRTAGFDIGYLATLRQVPIVYGNDLFQRQNLPTQFALRTDVVEALGFVFPPSLWHLYADNFILELGHRIGIRYRDDIEIEHLHPAAGKAEQDAHYARVNAPEVDQHDHDVFVAYLNDGCLNADVARVNASLAAKALP